MSIETPETIPETSRLQHAKDRLLDALVEKLTGELGDTVIVEKLAGAYRLLADAYEA